MTFDGTDLAQCLEVIGTAVKRARAGRPPQLVVASILRLAGHGEHDDFSYVADDIEMAAVRAGLSETRGEHFIKRARTGRCRDTAALARRRWRQEVEEAFSAAQREPVPDACE